MLKFRPITYSDSDLRSFKFISSTAIIEGGLCIPATVADNQNIAACKTFTANYSGATNASVVEKMKQIAIQDQIFPVYLNDPDIENVGATINQNDYVVGFSIKSGNEWEVHSDSSQCAIGSYTMLGNVVAASTGKFVAEDAVDDKTAYILAQCIGTYNGVWIRMRAI